MRPIYLLIIAGLILSNCGKEKTASGNEGEHMAHNESEKYSCPMHPNVVQDKPGKCPVCGMDLAKTTSTTSESLDLMLNDSQIKLANIVVQRISKSPIGQSIVVNGKIETDKQQSKVISSRAQGRIEKLFVKETGKSIQKGQPLYSIYSETLLTLQQEYLLAKEQNETLGKTEKRYQSFEEAARKKLLLYGLTLEQVDQIQRREDVKQVITFLAPASGVITELNVTEGQYISEGTELCKLEDLSRVWVEADLYPDETAFVKTGDKIAMRIGGTNEKIEGTVSFLSPEYKANSQIVTMRAAMINQEMKYKPGQQVQVFLTHSSREGITLPTDAVVRDGKGSHVYVQAGRNAFRPRQVKTGIESFDQIEITEGIQEGDTVAISGAYLLYSELIIKKGINPIEGQGHHH